MPAKVNWKTTAGFLLYVGGLMVATQGMEACADEMQQKGSMMLGGAVSGLGAVFLKLSPGKEAKTEEKKPE